MAENAKDLVRPDCKIHERVMRYFIPSLRIDFIMMFINIGCLFLGNLMLFIFYTLSPEVSEVLEIAAYLLILAPMVYRIKRCIRLISYSDFPLSLLAVVDAMINIVAISFLFSGVMPLPVTQIVAAVCFLINICLTLLSFVDSLVLYNRLVNRRYLVAEGVVIFKEKKIEGGGRVHWFNRMVVIKSGIGYIRTVEHILRRQYKQCSLASSVLMVVPDPLKSQIDSSIRIAAEPFGTKE